MKAAVGFFSSSSPDELDDPEEEKDEPEPLPDDDEPEPLADDDEFESESSQVSPMSWRHCRLAT
jgi:hypothetical protein